MTITVTSMWFRLWLSVEYSGEKSRQLSMSKFVDLTGSQYRELLVSQYSFGSTEGFQGTFRTPCLYWITSVQERGTECILRQDIQTLFFLSCKFSDTFWLHLEEEKTKHNKHPSKTWKLYLQFNSSHMQHFLEMNTHKISKKTRKKKSILFSPK